MFSWSCSHVWLEFTRCRCHQTLQMNLTVLYVRIRCVSVRACVRVFLSVAWDAVLMCVFVVVRPHRLRSGSFSGRCQSQTLWPSILMPVKRFVRVCLKMKRLMNLVWVTSPPATLNRRMVTVHLRAFLWYFLTSFQLVLTCSVFISAAVSMKYRASVSSAPDVPPSAPRHSGRRTVLPAHSTDNSHIGILAILYNNIGKDLSRVSMPVAMNEPLSLLQRVSEELEYSHLLDTANHTDDPYQRMVHLAYTTPWKRSV